MRLLGIIFANLSVRAVSSQPVSGRSQRYEC